MLNNKFRIGLATVVLLVILRLCLGCHFLYEGVWKIAHPEFSSEGFLRQAKGPAAPIFHAMIPDIDGRERLKIERVVSGDGILKVWRKVLNDAEKRYRAGLAKPYQPGLDEQTKKLRELAAGGLPLDEAGKKTEEQIVKEIERIEKQIQEKTDPPVQELHDDIQPILWHCEDKLEAFLEENEDEILAYLAGQKRPTGEQRDESAERVRGWLSAIAEIQQGYLQALRDFAEKSNDDIKDAISRSVDAVPPVFDKDLPAEKLVSGNRLRNPKGGEALRVTEVIRAAKFSRPWNELKQKVIRKYALDDSQQAQAEVIYRRYKEALKTVLAENQKDIKAHFGALDRLEARRAAGNNGAQYQKQRLYDEQRKLDSEVGVWLAGLRAADKGYQEALAGLLTEEQSRQGALPVPWTRMDWIDLAVTYGLTAIGLCLLLGLFTRPAAVAGGCFMIAGVLTQPAWPTIYPPDPPVVGHALLVNKDFIEMVALFLLATTAVGRWGGLDCFVGRAIDRLRNSRRGKENQQEGHTK
jgi:uncharacterized membrane protein YphA (DoxX/SURF4 family)